MPPSPAPARADAPPAGGGKKILGMPRTQFFVIAGIGAGLIVTFVIWRRKKAASASTAAAGTGGCPDGSAPDANGNCPQAATDLAGEIATLQTEIGDLQSALGSAGGGGSSAGAGATPTPPAVNPGGPNTTPAPPAPSTPGQTNGWHYPAPTGLKASRVSSHGAELSWNPVQGPSGQRPVSYTVHTSGPGANYSHIAAGTQTGEYGPGGKNLKPSTGYTSEVWANGGPVGPPHATVSWQTHKAGG